MRQAKLALGGLAALAATLVLGVALAGAVAPVLTVEDATSVEYTTAHVKGEVNPEDHETSYHFEWVTDQQFTDEGNSFAAAEPNGQLAGFGSTPEGVPATPEETLSGLHPATTYHLRLVAENTEGEHAEAVATNTFTTKAVAKPLVSGLAATEAHFSGMVNPNAPGPAPQDPGFNTHWSFSCSPGCGFSGESEGDLEADDTATEVSADPTGLTPNQAYDVTLHATNAGGEETETKVAAFTTPAIAPTITRETLWRPTSTSIQLNSLVNPHNAALSDCHFAYGAGGAFDRTAPCEAAIPSFPYVTPSGEGAVRVAARISGLTPGATYDFKLIATNLAGTTEEIPRSFTTPEPAAAESCLNQAFRDVQHAGQLPECRAFEMVSPLQKSGGDIVGDGATNVASTAGDAVILSTRTPFGDTIGSGVAGQTQYVARRGAAGWAAHSITPQPRADAYQTFFGATRYSAFSDDLGRAVLYGRDLPAASGDVPDRSNLYVEDTASRALQTVTMSQNGLPSPLPNPLFEMSDTFDWGVSADARHVAFVSRVPYLPAVKQAQELGQQTECTPAMVTTFQFFSCVLNVYQSDEGALGLAGVLPDGTIPQKGSDVPAIPGMKTLYRRTMSADGSRLLFVSPPTGNASQLYQRIDGARTARISESELDPSDPNYQPNPARVRLFAATPDGHSVFFSTTSPLLSEDTDEANDLYRWTDSADPATDSNLTMITHDGFDSTNQVIGASDDGQRVYYQTQSSDIVVWDHGVTRRVASSVPIAGSAPVALSAGASGPGLARVTPDGEYLAFATDAANGPPGELVGPTGEVTNRRAEMYLYDLADDTLACVSCPAAAPVTPKEEIAPGEGIVSPTATTGVITYYTPGIRPRFLGDSGRVFFTSPEALVPEDTNGVRDTYQYDPATGKLSLLSTGKGADPATFTEASSSGDDVFLVTRQRLVPSDTDGLVDLYDVRAGGGFSEPTPAPVAPCSGEGCQGAGSPPPASPTPSSSTEGRGNLRQRRCGPNKHRVRRNGKSRCARKPSKHQGHKTGRTH